MLLSGTILAAIRILFAMKILSLEGHILAGFTAIAHVYMGILLCLFWQQTRNKQNSILTLKGYGTLFWTMNVIEVTSAIISRM